MVVLVTGATGFIGRRVVKELLEHNYAVRCLVHTPGSERVFSDRSVEIYYGDMTNQNSIDSACQGVELVINLVSKMRPSRVWDLLSVNAVGVANLVSAVENADSIKHLVHVSVLGANDNPKERYLYSRWKGEQELKKTKIPYTIIRPSVITGELDSFSNILGSLVRSLPVVPVLGRGRNRVQPISVGDFAYCVVASLSRNDLESKTVELGGAQHLSVNEIIDSICTVIGRRRTKLHLPLWFSGVFCALMNIFMAKPIVNRELARMLTQRNVTDIGVVNTVFGITPKTFVESIDHLIETDSKSVTTPQCHGGSKRFESPSDGE